MPCPDCGASVEQTEADDHVCDSERRINYEAFLEAKELTRELEDYFDSPDGRFALWEAEQQRLDDA
ncbi:MAG: hypothetical protein WEC17_02945 [Candidatus Saccharimonadales bacterium]